MGAAYSVDDPQKGLSEVLFSALGANKSGLALVLRGMSCSAEPHACSNVEVEDVEDEDESWDTLTDDDADDDDDMEAESLKGHIEAEHSNSCGSCPTVPPTSDFLEGLRCASWSCSAEECTSHVTVVSLGSDFGPKLSFKAIGRGSPALPFDWMRTTLEGVLHFLRHDFEGFFDVLESEAVPSVEGMFAYRSSMHSFWHDDPANAETRQSYLRRRACLRAVCADRSPVLFVRSAVDIDELPRAGELIDELQRRFGPESRLLLLVDQQVTTIGSAVIEEWPDVMVHFAAPGKPARAPYAEPILAALKWAAGTGDAVAAEHSFTSLMDAWWASSKFDGSRGYGGIPAFVDAPASP